MRCFSTTPRQKATTNRKPHHAQRLCLAISLAFLSLPASAQFAAVQSLSTLNGSSGFRLDGGAADDRSGFAVSGAGDVNGDGLADLIIGARYADPNSVNFAGSSYVVFGTFRIFRDGFED